MTYNIAESIEYNLIIKCDILYLLLNWEYKLYILPLKYRSAINDSSNTQKWLYCKFNLSKSLISYQLSDHFQSILFKYSDR